MNELSGVALDLDGAAYWNGNNGFSVLVPGLGWAQLCQRSFAALRKQCSKLCSVGVEAIPMGVHAWVNARAGAQPQQQAGKISSIRYILV